MPSSISGSEETSGRNGGLFLVENMDPEHKVPPENLKLYAEEGCEQCLSELTQGRRDTKLTCVLVVDRNKFLHHQVFWCMVIIPGRSILESRLRRIVSIKSEKACLQNQELMSTYSFYRNANHSLSSSLLE